MLESKKNNYLLILGTVLFTVTLIIYLLIANYYPEKIQDDGRNIIIDNPYLFLLSTIILAPIIEELIFRLKYTNIKFSKCVFYLGSLAFIIYTQNYYILILLLIYALLDFKIKKDVLIYFLNALIFALMHYQLENLNNIYKILPIFFQFSIGLILIWVVINYNIKKAIIFHSVFNLTFITTLFFHLQCPNLEQKTKTNNTLIMTWQKTPIFNQTKISYSQNHIKAENITIEQLVNIVGIKNVITIDSLENNRYNFEIKSNNKEKLLEEDITILLIDTKLLKSSD